MSCIHVFERRPRLDLVAAGGELPTMEPPSLKAELDVALHGLDELESAHARWAAELLDLSKRVALTDAQLGKSLAALAHIVADGNARERVHALALARSLFGRIA